MKSLGYTVYTYLIRRMVKTRLKINSENDRKQMENRMPTETIQSSSAETITFIVEQSHSQQGLRRNEGK